MMEKNKEKIKKKCYTDLRQSNLQKESSLLDIHPNTNFPIACISSSAGGIEALTEFLSTLEEQSGLAYIVIQHLDPSHESQLPNIVSKLTSVSVVQASNNQEIRPDNILFPQIRLLPFRTVF